MTELEDKKQLLEDIKLDIKILEDDIDFSKKNFKYFQELATKGENRVKHLEGNLTGLKENARQDG